MNTLEFIAIDCIDPNPFQPASAKNEEKVLEIAGSLVENLEAGIGTVGLNQVPTARKVGERYQLAFGHHRHQAFVLLATETTRAYQKSFEKMPLILEDLTDQQMFEAMATENLQRREISFIEEAEMFHAYMTIFKKNSVETALRFQKSEEHVRGRIMFLQLPEAAKEQAKAGKLNVSLARDLVTVNKLAGEEGVKEALSLLAENEKDQIFDNPHEAIVDVLRELPEVQRMEYRLPWLEVKRFPVKHLDTLSRKVLAELLDVTNGDVARKELLDQVIQLLASGMEIEDAQFPSFLPDQLEKVRVLANPPACTACPFHTTFDGDHYCALKLCYERKQHAWQKAEVEALWKKLGIPLYVNEATDGKAVELNRWNDADAKLFNERHADLRLKQTSRPTYSNFEGLPNYVVVVVVGKTAEKRLKANGKAVEAAQTGVRNYQIEQKIKNLKDEHVHRFLWNVAVPAFEGLLEPLNNLPFTIFLYSDVMFDSVDFLPGMDSKEEQIHQIQGMKRKPEAFKQLRRLMIAEVLDRAIGWKSYHQFNGAKKVIVEAGKRCQKYAEQWNWKLLKYFDKQVEAAQAELDKAIKAVTAETEKT